MTTDSETTMTWLQALITKTYTSRCCYRSAMAASWIAVLGSLPALSAAEDAPKAANWYQVELVIFSQPKQDLSAEYWPEQLKPQYDNSAIQLMPADGFSEQAMLATEPGIVTDNALTALSAATEAQPLTPNLPTRPFTVPLLEEYQDGAFVLLNQEQLKQPTEVSDEPIVPINTARLKRKGHRILFQAHWRQPVHAKKESRAIIIRGGAALQEQPLPINANAAAFYELEGDIQLYLSRYLHLRPNLYLTLPLPPEWQPRHPNEIEAKLKTEQAMQQFMLSSDAQPSLAAMPPIADTPLPEASEPRAQYLTVKLDQSRRMRRNELHYIDHPLFGVLIRLTAYTPPLPEPEPEAIVPDETAPAASAAEVSDTSPTPVAAPANN
ncbi:MAG: CsiV family protein [Halopseudomonas sp.]